MSSNEHSIGAASAPANQGALPAAGSRLDSFAATRILRTHWVLLLVLAAFALATAVIPTMTPIAISDDWTYARSAQILLAEGRLTVFPVVVATAVAPIAWGALFGLFFGPTLGVFRLSTVVLTALAALALYALCRDLGVSRHRSAFGVATWLFNPLVFVLAFSFMTDPHFAALLIITMWLFARSLRGTEIDRPTFIAASAMAALSFLARQQGALIVPAVIVYLLLSRRLRFDRAGLILLLQLVAIPAVVAAGYYLWLRSDQSMAEMQTGFLREVEQRGGDGSWWLLRWLTVFQLVYLGFFTLPIMVAAIPALRGLVHRIRPSGWLLFALWEAIAVAGVGVLFSRGVLMPYIPQFFGSSGLGPPDLLGGRPIVLDLDAADLPDRRLPAGHAPASARRRASVVGSALARAFARRTHRQHRAQPGDRGLPALLPLPRLERRFARSLPGASCSNRHRSGAVGLTRAASGPPRRLDRGRCPGPLRRGGNTR